MFLIFFDNIIVEVVDSIAKFADAIVVNDVNNVIVNDIDDVVVNDVINAAICNAINASSIEAMIDVVHCAIEFDDAMNSNLCFKLKV